MNLQGFPRDFPCKLKPELEQAESTAIAPSIGVRSPISSEAGFLTVSPRSTDEPGVLDRRPHQVECARRCAGRHASLGSLASCDDN